MLAGHTCAGTSQFGLCPAIHTRSLPAELCLARAHRMPHVSSADGRFLLLPPCLGEQPSRDVEREALASRVRKVEEENQQLRLRLGQAQAESSDASPQWGVSAEDGDPPRGERSNRTACPKQRTVHKCEVGDGIVMAARWMGDVGWEAGTLLSIDVCATCLALLIPCSRHDGASSWLSMVLNGTQPVGEGVLLLCRGRLDRRSGSQTPGPRF